MLYIVNTLYCIPYGVPPLNNHAFSFNGIKVAQMTVGLGGAFLRFRCDPFSAPGAKSPRSRKMGEVSAVPGDKLGWALLWQAATPLLGAPSHAGCKIIIKWRFLLLGDLAWQKLSPYFATPCASVLGGWDGIRRGMSLNNFCH